MENPRYFRVITPTLKSGLLFDSYEEAFKFSELVKSTNGDTCCVDEVTISFPGAKMEVVK